MKTFFLVIVFLVLSVGLNQLVGLFLHQGVYNIIALFIIPLAVFIASPLYKKSWIKNAALISMIPGIVLILLYWFAVPFLMHAK